MPNLWSILKAISQLGLSRLAQNGVYRLGLRSGLIRIPPPSSVARIPNIDLEILPRLPEAASGQASEGLLQEAHEIVAGQVRLFGGELAPLDLAPRPPLHAWIEYERGRASYPAEDVKLIWEPARFGWAVPLARAYLSTRDDRFALAFWEKFEAFLAGNPPYLGPNWTSAQEAGLRIVTWGLVLKAISGSRGSSPERMESMARALVLHAHRIPPTLMYAKSQHNNHLLSEAAGLYTAGVMLPEHAAAARWRLQGWDLFNRALRRQIGVDGNYVQHSVNYHRLMLQLALWVGALAARRGESWPNASRERLAAATRWLQARVDPSNGKTPNSGNNDGSYLFPFGAYADFRPVLQAASLAFLGKTAFGAGPWDAFSDWLGIQGPQNHESAALGPEMPAEPASPAYYDSANAILHAGASWGMLRAAHYDSRPGQADQMHFDLWWRGEAVTLDPGTYRYTARAPWNHALATAMVHNSLVIDAREPMTRAGRFLWLDWDQARVLTCIPHRAVAQRYGYRRLGVIHQRTVQVLEREVWQVTDDLLPAAPRSRAHRFRLHWLFPDWPYEWQNGQMRLASPYGQVKIWVEGNAPGSPEIQQQLVRAGENVAGEGAVLPVWGWFSPTYNQKIAALSLVTRMECRLPARLVTTIALDRPSFSR